jgi:hypothetical protein
MKKSTSRKKKTHYQSRRKENDDDDLFEFKDLGEKPEDSSLSSHTGLSSETSNSIRQLEDDSDDDVFSYPSIQRHRLAATWKDENHFQIQSTDTPTVDHSNLNEDSEGSEDLSSSKRRQLSRYKRRSSAKR